MSNTQNNDARVDLGFCDPKLRGKQAQHGPDATQTFLNNFLGRLTNCNIHSAGCWGFYVVRTSFAAGDDQRVAGAMSKLDSAFAMNIKESRSFADPLNPSYIATDAEVMRRFHNVLIDDAQLHDATIHEVRSYLRDWIAAKPEPQDGPRFQTFILLDSQVLANLDRLPDSFTLDEWANLYSNRSYEWVKIVDVEDDWSTCRVWISDFVSLFTLLVYRDHGVSDVGVDEAEDGLDWPFYSAL